ncbi:MAG TPA: carboxypeptidase-like regulatory domain-containing protein, partial [Candidatus Thermoplasmatota archaeon]|nr:carboxypeptidase-like regulatory domain-containing protein [Candidatus Thermoplasmatota archaeon]
MRLALVSATILVFAGCLGGSSQSPAAFQDSKGGALYVEGLVVDQEIVPIASAVIVVKDRDGYMETDATGRFKIGPVDPGEYLVTAEKAGYAT